MSYKKKRSRKPITLEDLRLRATDAVKAIEQMILTEDIDPNRRINAVNALSGLISRYSKLVKTAELEKRIEKLESQITGDE